jgi:signal transduction histidine kinase
VDLALAPVRLRDLLEERVAAARVNHSDDAPELLVHDDVVVPVDRDRLAQAVDNLIQNAYRHGRPPVLVEVRRRGTSAEILVTDAGGGVTSDVAQRIFDRYATGGATRTTGLGLYIVRELARAHGGDAWWRSGSEGQQGFVISIPVDEAEVARAG